MQGVRTEGQLLEGFVDAPGISGFRHTSVWMCTATAFCREYAFGLFYCRRHQGVSYTNTHKDQLEHQYAGALIRRPHAHQAGDSAPLWYHVQLYPMARRTAIHQCVQQLACWSTSPLRRCGSSRCLSMYGRCVTMGGRIICALSSACRMVGRHQSSRAAPCRENAVLPVDRTTPGSMHHSHKKSAFARIHDPDQCVAQEESLPESRRGHTPRAHSTVQAACRACMSTFTARRDGVATNRMRRGNRGPSMVVAPPRTTQREAPNTFPHLTLGPCPLLLARPTSPLCTPGAAGVLA